VESVTEFRHEPSQKKITGDHEITGERLWMKGYY